MKALITFMIGILLGSPESFNSNSKYLSITQGKKTFGIANELSSTLYWLEIDDSRGNLLASPNLWLYHHITPDEFDCPLAFHIKSYVRVKCMGSGFRIELCADTKKKIDVEINGIYGHVIYKFNFRVGEPGVYSFFWDGKTSKGKSVAKGAYFITALSEREMLQSKFVILG